MLVLLAIGTGRAFGANAPHTQDSFSNELVDQGEHDADRALFEERETEATGLGPIYNAQSCTECHHSPIAGGASQLSVLRAGHINPSTTAFVEPSGGSLMHAHAIDPAIDIRIPDSEDVRSRRITLPLLGDGYIEAIDDSTLTAIAKSQPAASHGRIAGQVLYVPVLEAEHAPKSCSQGAEIVQPGCRVGRFGWKNQHASLLSFSADSYCNEEGITNRLFPTQNTALGKSLAEYDSVPSPKDVRRQYHQTVARTSRTGDLSYIDVFARFIRATEAPPRDTQLAATPAARTGSRLFEKIGCGICHVSTLKTAPAGTTINSGQFQLPTALGGKVIHPYSDFLLHDVGTGDGIVQNGGQSTANKMRTAPLWGLRTRQGLMHDGETPSRHDAIFRHGGEAKSVINAYRHLTPAQRKQLLTFLDSL